MQVKIRHLPVVSALLLVAAFVGCGGSSTPQAAGPPPTIEFGSPGVSASGTVLSAYKCDEKKIWLPLSWGALPANTKELVIYVGRYGAPEIKAGGEVTAGLAAQQLIVGLQPTLHRLPVGKVPHGVLVGSFVAGRRRRSICANARSTSGILFSLYALPRRQNIGKGPQGGNLINRLQSEAIGYGTFTATYGKGSIAVNKRSTAAKGA